jgi:NAD(P)-dependent dehydrogenase (short-subunit alcohol dehydrogenase family)
VTSTGRGALEGKVALVTGGSRGLGRAMALAFADAGADVIIASRKLENCQAVAREVEARGRRALAVSCHVGHWDELDGLVELSYETFGRIDVLVNNAGMSLLYESLPAVTESMWDKVVDLNLKGPFRLTALVGSRMAGGPYGGSIINVSSTGSIRPAPTISSGCPPRCRAWLAFAAFSKAGMSHDSVTSVMKGPAMMQLTRTDGPKA